MFENGTAGPDGAGAAGLEGQVGQGIAWGDLGGRGSRAGKPIRAYAVDISGIGTKAVVVRT